MAIFDGNPVGTGIVRKPQPKSTIGNAEISIPGLWSGRVWINSFNTSVYTQFESDQVHRGIAWFPIRRSEIFVQFTIAWPLQTIGNIRSFSSMQKFQDALRQHQQNSALNLGSPSPMVLTYYNNTGLQRGYPNPIIDDNLVIHGNNQTLLKEAQSLNNQGAGESFNAKKPLESLQYQGWIDTVEKEYARFKSIYVRAYRMNVINTKVTGSITIPKTTASNFVPNQISTSLIGPEWISANTSSGKGINTNLITGSTN